MRERNREFYLEVMPEDVHTFNDGNHSFRHLDLPLIVARQMSLFYPRSVYYVVRVNTGRYRVYCHYDMVPPFHKGVVTTFVNGINAGWPLRLPNNLARQIGELKDRLSLPPIPEIFHIRRSKT